MGFCLSGRHQGPDPYEYSAGRWLRDDVAHRRARRISFNFDALCRRAVGLCAGAKSIASYEKREGGCNRVFIFTTDNNKVILAKLPFSNAGPAYLTTESEVATTKFLKKYTHIPIPTIIEWNSNRCHEIGSEYIFMERAPGVSLQVMWPAMSAEQRIQCISGIYDILSPLNEMRFPAYGSLYTRKTSLESAVAVAMTEDDEFCVGPHVDNRYWGCNVGDDRYYHIETPNRGPWLDLPHWGDALIDAGVSRIPPQDHQKLRRPRYFGTVDMHLQLLREARLLVKRLSQDERVLASATPTMFPGDLNKRNIMVSKDDPTVITSMFDWQSTSIDPAFWFATATPDFVETPNSLEGITNDTCLKFHLSRLAEAQTLDERMVRPFIYASRTWKDGVVALRHDLLMISRAWNELGLGRPCLVPVLTSAETSIHGDHYQRFETAQKLRKQVADHLDVSSEGWVPAEAWSQTQSQHRQLFRDALQAILCPEAVAESEQVKTEADLKEIWPFDL